MAPYNSPFGQNPYFNFGDLYGAKQSYASAPIVKGPTGYLEQNPDAAYARHISPYAGGTDPFSQFVQKQFSRIHDQGYQSAVATNPNLTFQNYLRPYGADFFKNMWMNLSQTQRGENPAISAGRARWESNG